MSTFLKGQVFHRDLSSTHHIQMTNYTEVGMFLHCTTQRGSEQSSQYCRSLNWLTQRNSIKPKYQPWTEVNGVYALVICPPYVRPMCTEYMCKQTPVTPSGSKQLHYTAITLIVSDLVACSCIFHHCNKQWFGRRKNLPLGCFHFTASPAYRAQSDLSPLAKQSEYECAMVTRPECIPSLYLRWYGTSRSLEHWQENGWRDGWMDKLQRLQKGHCFL